MGYLDEQATLLGLPVEQVITSTLNNLVFNLHAELDRAGDHQIDLLGFWAQRNAIDHGYALSLVEIDLDAYQDYVLKRLTTSARRITPEEAIRIYARLWSFQAWALIDIRRGGS